MKTTPTLVLLVGAALSLGAPTAPAQTPRAYTGYFFFGDSLSDTGNLSVVTSGTQPPAPYYFNGRFSNGPVFTEQFAGPLALATTAGPTVRTNLNFAFGGASAAGSSTVPPALALQLGMMQQRGLTPGDRDLFVILAGANDLLNTISVPANQNFAAVGATATAAATAVATAARDLYGAGARQVVVLNLPDLAKTARFTTGTAAPAAPLASAGVQAFNTELSQRLQALSVPTGGRLTALDLNALFGTILDRAATFGFSVTQQEYLGQLILGQNPGNESNYLFWDGIHPTTRAHRLIALALGEATQPELTLGTAVPQADSLLAWTGLTARIIDQRLDARTLATPTRPGSSAWFRHTHGTGGQDATALTASGEHDLRVQSIGLDGGLTDSLTAGLALSVGQVAHLTPGRASFSARGHTLSTYARWRSARWFADLALDWGAHDSRSLVRTTSLDGLATTGRLSAHHYGSRLRAGWVAPVAGGLVVPWLGLRQARVKTGLYAEQGVPGLNFLFEGQQARSLAGQTGFTVVLNPTWHGWRVNLALDAAYQLELSDDTRALTGRLAGTASTPVTIHPADGLGDRLDLGVRASLRLREHWGLTLGYDFGLPRRGQDSHTWHGALQRGF